MIVGLVRETAAFERLGEEGDPRLLEEEIAELLGDGKPAPATRSPPSRKAGSAHGKRPSKPASPANAHLFRSVPGTRSVDRLGPRSGYSPRGSGRVGARYVPRRIGEPAPADPLPFGEGGGARDPEFARPAGATDLSLLPDEATDCTLQALRGGTSSASDATPAPSDEERLFFRFLTCAAFRSDLPL
jgi:hypothetical protein